MTAIGAANSSASDLRIALVTPDARIGGMTASGLGQTDIGNPAVVGGAAHQFFVRVCAKYGKTGPCYTYEPHVAQAVFEDMVAAFPGITVIYNSTLVAVNKSGSNVTAAGFVPTAAAAVADGYPSAMLTVYTARLFADASYEGDLLAMAGVPFAWGREANTTYNESLAGRLPVPNSVGGHQFNVPFNYSDGNGNPLPMIYTGDPGVPGAADYKVQAYNFRMCLTTNASNSVPIPRPANYDPAQWQLLRNYLAAAPPSSLRDLLIISSMPNEKTDINNEGPISTDFIGGSWTWPTATPAQRAAVYRAHVDYTAGLFTFLATDPSVPPAVAAEMQTYGLAADEFTDTGNWPWQLYVREGRRMVSDFVFSQADRVTNLTKPDAVGLFSYNIDNHNAQRIPDGAYVRNEGDVEMYGDKGPGQIPWRAVLPPPTSANLLVPVALSASHIGFGALRLEPQWMIIGQAVGAGAALALDGGVPVHSVSVPALQALLRSQGQLIDMPS